MDRRLFTCDIFIDLKKAFDSVNHKMLLDNLNYYLFRGVVYECFKSCWSDRAQTTSIDSYISAKFTCPCGVPQVNCKQAPPNNLNLFCRTSSIHRYSTRSSTSLNFYPQHSRTDLQKKCSLTFCHKSLEWESRINKKNKHVKSTVIMFQLRNFHHFARTKIQTLCIVNLMWFTNWHVPLVMLNT